MIIFDFLPFKALIWMALFKEREREREREMKRGDKIGDDFSYSL